jgi:hypothetical protein
MIHLWERLVCGLDGKAEQRDVSMWWEGKGFVRYEGWFMVLNSGPVREIFLLDLRGTVYFWCAASAAWRE